MQKLKKIFFSFIILAIPLYSAAQCSLCSAGVASNLKNGGDVGKSINSAILYLMAFPYIVFMAFIVYRYHGFIAFQFRQLVQRWRMFRASL